MYLPRELISQLYNSLIKNHHRLSPPVLILAALEPDALCACRILASLFKRDFISHNIHPVSGYSDLSRAGDGLIRPLKISQGGTGGVVICLGVGGLVDLKEQLGLDGGEEAQDGFDGVEVWVFDARRPWNLENVFGGLPEFSMPENTDAPGQHRSHGVEKGKLHRSFRSGRGGIIVIDDGDIDEELTAERDAWYALVDMPEVEDPGDDSEESEEEHDGHQSPSNGKKRKSWSGREDEEADSEGEDEPPAQRRRSNSGSSISTASVRSRSVRRDSRSSSPSRPASPKPQSAKTLRRKLLNLRRGHETVLDEYFQLGTSYSEPISSLMYSLAADLGREDNDLLWLTIIGVSSLELSGQTSNGLSTSGATQRTQFPTHHQSWRTTRSSLVHGLLRDEVRRMNGHSGSDSSTSPSDKFIRLTPDPRFVLLRHWSLYESMLHSPYLASRLHLWNDSGRKRLHKLLAKMGISLSQCRQTYTHMDVTLKKNLRESLLRYAAVYGLDEIVPEGSGDGTDFDGWGFVRNWGWKAQLSAVDVGIIVGAILEVGQVQSYSLDRFLPTPPESQHSDEDVTTATAPDRSATLLPRFFAAYDALDPSRPSKLLDSIPLAQSLLKAILRTGTSLLAKHQVRHLRAFRMGVVKDGPDLSLFASSPAALVKLALWVGEAVAMDEKGKKNGMDGSTPLVLAALDEVRGNYVVVGTGGGLGEGSSAAEKEKKREREEKKALKEEKRNERKKAKEEKQAAKAAKKAENEGNDDEEDDAEEDETEEEDDDDSSDEEENDVEVDEAELARRKKRGYGRNRFGIAFAEVVNQTQARVKIDSFDHCVVEVKKDDLGGFLEGLSQKTVVGR